MLVNLNSTTLLVVIHLQLVQSVESLLLTFLLSLQVLVHVQFQVVKYKLKWVLMLQMLNLV
jgi:hypothetical protein